MTATEERTAVLCEICGNEPRYCWTDEHGVAVCYDCGAPYRILHYEGEGDERRRVQKGPELDVRPEYVPLLQGYWQETGRRVMPGSHCFPGSSYILATRQDCETWDRWIEANLEAYRQAHGITEEREAV